MRTWWIPLAFLACSAPREPLTNTGDSGTVLRIGPIEPLGWLGLATAAKDSNNLPRHAPVSAAHPLVTPVERDDVLDSATSIAAIGTTGGVQQFKTGARAKVPYGCDGHTLEVTTFTGPRLTPGAVWLLPPTIPPTWKPAPLPIVSRSAVAAQRSYAIGPLALDLRRTGDLRGTLTISRNGKVVHTAPFERHLMEGADAAPIHLAEGGPGIPEPIAAWTIGPSGPILLVLTQPGYEGTTLRALLVEAASARAIESMEMYLYSCAF
ncbi:MAG: hypothetical protein H0T42_14245 [Deltaproteobacteria bacterium]|nr:hypothetical protein [Deltaproteobacteria bacterium]